MSSTTRESSGPSRDGSFNGIVRRIVGLPRSIAGGVTRAMCRGGCRGRRDQISAVANFQPQFQQQPFLVPEEWTFLTTFEQQYGTTQPFFYACRFMEALKIAEEERKFMFMYLHLAQHPFTPSFCRETLCSEMVVQFLDANFVCWGALADRGEGLQTATTLQPAAFPCCAVVAAAGGGDSISVLQQMEGPISPAELVEILQSTLEEQGSAFGNGRARQERTRMRARSKEEEAKIRSDRQLREEQDAAYLAALKIDKEKEQKAQRPQDSLTKATYGKLRGDYAAQKQHGKGKEAAAIRETQNRDIGSLSMDPAQILIRFPNGDRRELKFSSSDKIQSIYRCIDSLSQPGIGSYSLVSTFPRRVYGADQMGTTLKEAGLHPKATLFLELT